MSEYVDLPGRVKGFPPKIDILCGYLKVPEIETLDILSIEETTGAEIYTRMRNSSVTVGLECQESARNIPVLTRCKAGHLLSTFSLKVSIPPHSALAVLVLPVDFPIPDVPMTFAAMGKSHPDALGQTKLVKASCPLKRYRLGKGEEKTYGIDLWRLC